ncbi:MAG: hypothetical protein ACTSU4_03100 [Promethearchaeota archaeon]
MSITFSPNACPVVPMVKETWVSFLNNDIGFWYSQHSFNWGEASIHFFQLQERPWP